MENGESLLDVIDETSELFGSNGGATFDWADEILAENEADPASGPATEHGNLGTTVIPTNVLMTSQNYITSSNPSQTFTIASQHPFLSSSGTNSADLQQHHGATIVGQTVVNPVNNVAQSIPTQILQQGNQQFILKTAGGQLQLTTQASLQFQQPLLQSGIHASSNQYQSAMAHSQSNRQSPALAASPLQNRSMTPNSVGLPVTFVTTPSSQTVTQLKSASPAPNVNILHLPQGIQQAQQQLQLTPGTVLQIPGAGAGQNLVNANLIQGLSTQQQGTLVNTQNTVIQNPNVVNLNVAHHVPIGGIQAAPQAPFNIQGTLIQTPEGKSILIPSQNIAQAVNIQSLGQLSLPTQVPQQQNPNTMANMIKLQAAQGAERSNQGISQLVLNHQGQQVLIQRTPNAGSQPQNIVVRTLPQNNIVQLQQNQQRNVQAQTTVQTVGPQTQQVKLVQQGTNQSASNVSVNIGGHNVNLGNLSLQNLQLVQGNTSVSTATVQPDLATSLPQQQVTFQQSQGQDPVISQQRQTLTSQHNIIYSVQQHQNPVSNVNQSQSNVQNAVNIAAQNCRGLSNMQQLMQKLQGNKLVTLQSVTSSNIQTMSHGPPVVAKVTTMSPNVNILQIKREKIDSNAVGANSNISSSGPQTVKSLMLQRQAGTLGTAKIIVKQEPVVKMEPPAVLNPCSSVSHSSLQSTSSIEGLLATSGAFTTAHVTSVTNTISQSPLSLSNSLVSNSIQQTVPSVDIKPFINQSSTSVQNSSGSPFIIPSQSDLNMSHGNTASVVSALNNSNDSVTVTSASNSFSGNLNSISPHETSSSQVNSSTKPTTGATLQTIHLPPELQQNFQRVQAKIREVNMMKNLTSVERQNKLQQLNMIQRKILLKGRVLATTRADPHHVQRGLDALTSSGTQSNDTSQIATGVSQSPGQQSTAQHSLPTAHQEIPSSGQSPGLHGLPAAQQVASSDQHYLSSAQQSCGQHIQRTQSSFTSSQATSLDQFSFLEQNHQSQIASDEKVTSFSNVLKSSPPLITQNTVNMTAPPVSLSNISNTGTSSQMSRTSPLILGTSSLMSGTSSLMSGTSSQMSATSASISLNHSSMSRSGTSSYESGTTVTISSSLVTSAAPSMMVTSSNMTPVVSSSIISQPTMTTDSSSVASEDLNKAVPTQIKIGNRILTLNLTRQQKEKVQSYLDRMTPEQQHQYLQTQQGILSRIQRKQELNSQIQAQVDAHKQKQQQNLQSLPGSSLPAGSLPGSSLPGSSIPGSSLPGSSLPGSSLPATLQKISVVPQKAIVPGKLLEAPVTSSTTHVPEVKVIPVPASNIMNKMSAAETLLRGQKRSLMDIPKGTLINQQMRQDQNLAVNPDMKRPFRSRSDACRRLLRYHVFQSYGPSKEQFKKFDSYMEDVASDLLRKKDRMLDKYRILMLQESMRMKPSAELVMLQRLQNQELKKLLEEEKQLAEDNPDSFIPMPLRYMKSESDLDISPDKIKKEPEEEDSSPSKTDTSSDHIKTEPISDSESHHEPSPKKMKTLVIRLDSRLNFQSSFKRNSLGSGSSVEGSETVESDSTKEQMDTGASQASDDEDADSVKTEIVDGELTEVDGELTEEETVEEELVEEEIVTDFSPEKCETETRTECGSKPLLRTKASYKHFDSEPARMLVEKEADKAILSISSAEESQSDDESTENSRTVSPPSFTRFSENYKSHGNAELAGESIYFNQVQSDLNALNSNDQYSNISPARQLSTKYIPEHSPVSNDSYDNETANSLTDLNTSGYFDKFKMYQPITESLTDSEENSYYSADNTVEQNSVTCTIDDGENVSVPWSQSSHLTQPRQYCESEHSSDSDPEVKAQMESAINSILSLNQGAPSEPPQKADYSFNQSSHLFTAGSAYQDVVTVDDSQSESRMEEEDTEVSAPCTDDETIADDDGDDDVIVINDDIDAAVQSILI